MQLSDKSCELAEENDRLFDKNKEQRRRIELLETEQSELVRRSILILLLFLLLMFSCLVKGTPKLMGKILHDFLTLDSIVSEGIMGHLHPWIQDCNSLDLMKRVYLQKTVIIWYFLKKWGPVDTFTTNTVGTWHTCKAIWVMSFMNNPL